MSSHDKQVGEALRVIRGHMSQEALAGAMQAFGFPKWSQSTVWSVERGSRPLRLTEAAAIADMFEIPIDQLVATEERRTVERARRQVDYWGYELGRSALQLREAQEALARALKQYGSDVDDSELGFLPHEKARATLPPDRIAAAALSEAGGEAGVVLQQALEAGIEKALFDVGGKGEQYAGGRAPARGEG